MAASRLDVPKHVRLPRVLRRAFGYLRFARKHVGASATSLFIIDENQERVRGIVSEWDWTRTSFSSNLRDWPTVERAFGLGAPQPISVADARGTEVVWFERDGIGFTVCVPMHASEGAAVAPAMQRRLGVLFFDFADAADRAGVDLAFLADVGRRCARAIERRLAHVELPAEPIVVTR